MTSIANEGEVDALVGRVLAGERSALARVITLLERDPDAASRLDLLLAPHTGRAYTVGITGAPGAGKSTLLGAMLAHAVEHDQSVAVLALDPVSPLTGGAILGDRLRMEHVAADQHVFIRSATATTHSGGLSVTTPLILRALDAAGWPQILLETVGVGQSELAIVEAAMTTVVVLNPGNGDEIQSVKAGLMEIADVFVINKADHPAAPQLKIDIERLIAAYPLTRWRPPIVETVATARLGAAALWAAVDTHREYQHSNGLLAKRRERFFRLAVRAILQQTFLRRFDQLASGDEYDRAVHSLADGTCSLPDAAARLLAHILREPR